MQEDFLAAQLFVPNEIVRRVVEEFGVDLPAHVVEGFQSDDGQEHSIGEGKVRGVVEGVPKDRRLLFERSVGGERIDTVRRSGDPGWKELSHHFPIILAAKMPDHHGPGVNHENNLALLDTPGVGGCPVENLVNDLNFDEVISAPDASDLSVARETALRAEKVIQTQNPFGLEASKRVSFLQLFVQFQFVKQSPKTVDLRPWNGLAQAHQSIQKESFSLPSSHWNIATPFKEEVTEFGFQSVQVFFDLRPIQVRQMKAHTAVDVVTDRLGE